MTRFGVSYFGNRFLSHARSDIKRISESCHYIVHTVSEADLIYHKAVMAKFFSESRKAGLEVWADPWGLGGVFGGEAMSHFLLEHRDTWQVMSDGRVRPAACLNRPEWRSFAKEWVLNVRDMGAQVLFWDEPHIVFDFESELAGIFSCSCPTCSQLFRKKFGNALPSRLNDDVRTFRLETMKNFLEDIMAFSKSKGLRNALCLYAFKGNAEFDRIWQKAAALGDLDVFGCDPYWRWRSHRDPKVHVSEFSDRVVEHSRINGKQSQIWIQSMRLPSGVEEEIDQAIKAAVDKKVDYVAAWSYDGGEILDTVLSENPERVWQVTEQAFKRYRV